jgi:hypothetical protein
MKVIGLTLSVIGLTAVAVSGCNNALDQTAAGSDADGRSGSRSQCRGRPARPGE